MTSMAFATLFLQGVIGLPVEFDGVPMKNDLMHFSEESLYRVNRFVISIDTGHGIVHNLHAGLFRRTSSMFLNNINCLNMNGLCRA